MGGRTNSNGSLYPLLLTLVFLYTLVEAQLGLQTQDLTTTSVFSLQKKCAQECFVQSTGGCPYDLIGSKIGCQTWACNVATWLATNDCYCRTDLQRPALDFISYCVSRECTVGDNKRDVSTAASIYAGYCQGKGYSTPTIPASVDATATGSAGGSGTRVTTGAGIFNPPSSATSSPDNVSSSNKLSTTTIIGIAVGSAVGLLLIGMCIRQIFRNRNVSKPHMHPQFAQQPPPPPSMPPTMPPMYQPPAPIFPRDMHAGTGGYLPRRSPDIDRELGPDDSASMVSGAPGVAPTLLSGTGGPPRRWQ